MTLGFTGTEYGMTQHQRATVKYLFRELLLTVLHHGDCLGADKEAHAEAVAMCALVVVHPPKDSRKRAFCGLPHTLVTIRPEFNYLTRNHHIVRDGRDGLIATPRTDKEPKNLRGEGTWTTINYARSAGRHLWIVRRDGTFVEECVRAVSL